ncbi:FAD-dependent oxidoreductase [Legionella cardiaca]|uniref:FAD-binding protein n=1 Tax=Legionella cardiaca TaxID=1071983 RepID=A0ABY8AV03_9GAMM|nr:FAD-dependent oxidoreductase [Legionella cardiaca]WED44308.1 FAD-binding protein [Legionella cardiaca]
MTNPYNEEDTPADVAIVGLGPGGLTAALELAQQGKKIVVFHNRDAYIRGQRLVLSRDSITFLKKQHDKTDLQDSKFWEKYYAEGTVQTKDIEKYLYRKLLKLPNVTVVKSLPTSDKAIDLIEKGTEGLADCIKLKNGEKYYFRNLLGADGIKHSTANLVANCFGESVDYKQADTQVRYPYHAVVQLQLKSGEAPSKLKAKRGIMEEMQTASQQGWKEPYHPECYIFTNAAQSKFYFAGEIPKQIFEASEEERAELLKKWACFNIEKHYGLKEEQLEYRKSKKTPAKDKLQVTIFEMPLAICQKPVFDLSNGVFAQIGDARRTPNYNFGHGVNDAIMGGIAFSQAMSSALFAKDTFAQAVQRMDKIIDDKMKMSKQNREQVKERAKRKLLKALDDLIQLLDKDSEKTPLTTAKLERAKELFETTSELTTMYEALSEIKTIVEEKNNNIFYWAYNFINCCANFESTMKLNIFEKIMDNLDLYLREQIPANLKA